MKPWNLYKEFKVKNCLECLVSYLKPILRPNTLLTHAIINWPMVYIAMHISQLTNKHLFRCSWAETFYFRPNPNHRTSPRPIAGLQSGFVIPICNRLWAAPKKRRRKFSTFYAPLVQPTSDSIKVWPRAEKILSNPDWLVVIQHSKEFAFVLLKIGRGSGVSKTNGQFWRGLGRPCDDAIDSQVTRVLTRLVRGRFQSHC